MEAHFVHYSCDYPNVGASLTKSNNFEAIPDPYTLAVIGVMADATSVDNQAFKLIIDSIPLIKFPAEAEVEGVPGETIIENFVATELLPLNRNDFYYYEGSLTTPNCNPVVRWHVLKHNIGISQNQIDTFRELMHDANTTGLF